MLTFESEPTKYVVRLSDTNGAEIQTKSLPVKVASANNFTVATFSINGKYLAAGSDSPSASIRIFDVEKNQEIKNISLQYDSLSAVAISSDGTRLATVCSKHYGVRIIFICDVKTGEEIRKITGDAGRLLTVAFSPDGTLLATGSASNDNAAIKLYETRSGEKIRTIDAGFPRALAFSTAGNLLAAGYDSGDIELFEVIKKK